MLYKTREIDEYLVSRTVNVTCFPWDLFAYQNSIAKNIHIGQTAFSLNVVTDPPPRRDVFFNKHDIKCKS